MRNKFIFLLFINNLYPEQAGTHRLPPRRCETRVHVISSLPPTPRQSLRNPRSERKRTLSAAKRRPYTLVILNKLSSVEFVNNDGVIRPPCLSVESQAAAGRCPSPIISRSSLPSRRRMQSDAAGSPVNPTDYLRITTFQYSWPQDRQKLNAK